jgi:hypothetical protein
MSETNPDKLLPERVDLMAQSPSRRCLAETKSVCHQIPSWDEMSPIGLSLASTRPCSGEIKMLARVHSGLCRGQHEKDDHLTLTHKATYRMEGQAGPRSL